MKTLKQQLEDVFNIGLYTYDFVNKETIRIVKEWLTQKCQDENYNMTFPETRVLDELIKELEE